MLNLKEVNFLIDSEIKEVAPSIYTKEPLSSVSKHYVHIPTNRVIKDMRRLGWGVVDAKEVKARKDVGFQKHLVVFRNPDVVIDGEDGDVVFPQILLTNSHDGRNAFNFTAGLFRMICENGLVVSDEEFNSVKIRHMGYSFEELRKKIKIMVENLPSVVDNMNKMKDVILSEEEAMKFAEKALTTRFSEKELKRITVDLLDLISPDRDEDKGGDLWKRLNVVQEKLIMGNFDYSIGKKVRKARMVKNFKQDQKLNKELFEIALEYVK